MSTDYGGRYVSQAVPDVECEHCASETCEGDCVTRREFEKVGEGYRLTVPGLGLELCVDRLRRESHALVGELAVRCRLPGARTVGDGLLSVSDLNLSSQRARSDRARFLAGRARLEDEKADWVGVIEELAQQVIQAERTGAPAVLLRDIPRPSPDDLLHVEGLPLLARHPQIIFGDGGSAKSYVALFVAGKLDQAGRKVCLVDWELAGEDHRERLDRMFGEPLPAVRYLRCDRPLVHEVDRLRRVVRDEHLDFLIFDSISFAVDGPPEAAEVASRYLQAVRQLGPVGTLHVAHISKQEGSDRKPFGSSFWFNGARAVWYAKAAETGLAGDRVSLGLFCRKMNTGRIPRPVGFEIDFGDEQTTFRSIEVTDAPELASSVPLKHRIQHAVRGGALTVAELAEELDAPQDSIKKAIARDRGKTLVRFPGPEGSAQVGLAGRNA